ncbi:hypothetical protein KAT08_02780 [Candidatus Babeliales bacterium]|nr:hypothetical protein [Candidatus Babeliales bacterium]
MKKIIIFFLFQFFVYINLFSIKKVVVLDKLDDIIKTTSLNILIELDTNCAVYKNHLSFSVDHPKVLVKNWKLKSDPKVEYIQAFMSEKEIFVKSFDVELELKFLSNDKKIIKDELCNTFLNISCLVLEQNGKTKPENLLIKLFDKNVNKIYKKKHKVDNLKTVDIKRLNTKIDNDCRNDNNFLEKKLSNKNSLNCPNFILFILILLFLFSLYCFFEKSDKFWTFKFIVGILSFCFATSLFVKFLMINHSFL